jgi:uncharacterized protein (DUF433 family)/DNA-binding transcriptional MerR regulator
MRRTMGNRGAALGLTELDQEQLRAALCSTRGRYLAERASQLSGVPRTTVYYWAREGFLVPDHYHLHPKMWSYRDLVLLRLFAWLRNGGMPPADARLRAGGVRQRLDQGELPGEGVVRSDGSVFLIGNATVDELTGVQLFESLVPLVSSFDLLMPMVDGHGRQSSARPERWRGPHLLRPSRRTAISPWVLSGEPCVVETRIPSASLYALTEERGLASADIVNLYPAIGVEDIEDAVGLERALRSHALAA